MVSVAEADEAVQGGPGIDKALSAAKAALPTAIYDMAEAISLSKMGKDLG
jgi:hypothetical protein